MLSKFLLNTTISIHISKHSVLSAKRKERNRKFTGIVQNLEVMDYSDSSYTPSSKLTLKDGWVEKNWESECFQFTSKYCKIKFKAVYFFRLRDISLKIVYIWWNSWIWIDYISLSFEKEFFLNTVENRCNYQNL